MYYYTMSLAEMLACTGLMQVRRGSDQDKDRLGWDGMGCVVLCCVVFCCVVLCCVVLCFVVLLPCLWLRYWLEYVEC